MIAAPGAEGAHGLAPRRRLDQSRLRTQRRKVALFDTALDTVTKLRRIWDALQAGPEATPKSSQMTLPLAANSNGNRRDAPDRCPATLLRAQDKRWISEHGGSVQRTAF